MTDINGLAAFLRARLDEDEEAARAAGGEAWHWEHDSGDMCNDSTCPYGELATEEVVIMQVHGFDVQQDDRHVADHIARHDPARVLRETAAKKQIVTHMARLLETAEGDSEVDHYDALGSAELTLALLAAPYANHPDYQEQWKP